MGASNCIFAGSGQCDGGKLTRGQCFGHKTNMVGFLCQLAKIYQFHGQGKI
jgi:hypothetical protein